QPFHTYFYHYLPNRFDLVFRKMELFPFSFKEILDYKKINYSDLSSLTNAAILNEFDIYLENGGIPDFIKYNNLEFLKRLYEDIVQKDLVARFGIRNNIAFRKVTQYLMTNFTKEVSYNSLTKIIGIQSPNSIKDYIGYLQDSYLIFELHKYDFSLKRQYVSNKKIYVIDNGIRNRVAFRFGADLGNLLENIVFIELKMRQKDLYYYKTKNNMEVDFFVKENNPQLIQVCYSIEDYKTKEREIKSLKTAMDELDLKEGLILTYNSFDDIKIEDKMIYIRPTWKWLIAYTGKRRKTIAKIPAGVFG
ncbi:MAG: ATP-binding protein, partial [Bacteroidetes bacterium]|nr:ATP-binding protein [Bacteroidota bacterium]